ncbi:MAG: restriction endonuclease subunit S [Commensalibacter sp.]
MITKLLKGATVKWKTLGEVAEIGTGNSNRQDESEDGDYPFYVRSKNILKSNTYQFNETAIIIPGEGGIGDIFHYVKGKYALHQRAYRIHVISSILNTKFLYYLMSNKFKQYIITKSVGATSISIRKPMLDFFQIPIPPLAVQAEIVRILDAFTALTAELTAELKARKKQYNYYRDQLLTFKKGEVKWKTLGEVGEICMCKRILKHQTSDVGDIPFYKIGTFGKKPNAYISREIYNNYKARYNYPKIGEVLISASGTIGKTVIFDGKDSYFQDSNIVWIKNEENEVLNKYLFYIYQIAKWDIAEGGTIGRLYNDNLRKLKIPIPPLTEQERIVSILDKFDTLTTSITEGLPKEIALRQQQYEYYRDQLLNFPKA